jgi:drug/metabolite transporter (DMT)-like permease
VSRRDASVPVGGAVPVPPSRPVTTKPLGLIALCVAILFFSLGSTLVKKAALPGPTLAFWRMLATASVWWIILYASERRIINWTDIRRTLVPGIAFGLNLTAFFTGVTKTTVANAEFVASLSPLVVVPAGAFLFKEHINPRALWLGVLSLAGLTLVLFNAPTTGEASWTGNSIVFGAVFLWAIYLLSSRPLRNTMSVQSIMASIMTTATVTIFPITLIRGELDDLTVHSLPYIAILTLMTGTFAHGLIVYSQRTVPVGTISILQVAQPALAVAWAYLLLDQSIRAIQLVGMALVIGGLLAVVMVTRRMAAKAAEALEPVGPASTFD